MKILPLLSFIGFALIVNGCASESQRRYDTHNAFLQQYETSKEGKEGHELISVWKKGVAWQTYKKAIVEPVWVGKDVGVGFNRMPHADKVELMEKLEFMTRDSLKPMFKLAKQAGPETLRITLFITDNTTINTLLSSLLTIHPDTATVSGFQHMANDAEVFQGRSGVGGRIVDSTTGNLLMMFADHTKDDELLHDFAVIGGSPDKHYKFLTKQLGYQLCREQRQTYCQEP